MYGKSYESKYEGSMVGAGLHVFAVWDYMTTKARNGYVEVNPVLLAFTLGGPKQDPKVIEDALEFLQRPDPLSRSKLEEGRRVVREGQYQYRIVNWEEYNRIRTEQDRRAYNRRKQAEFRSKKKGGDENATDLEVQCYEESQEDFANSSLGPIPEDLSPAQRKQAEKVRRKVAREEAIERQVRAEFNPDFDPSKPSPKIKLAPGQSLASYIKKQVREEENKAGGPTPEAEYEDENYPPELN